MHYHETWIDEYLDNNNIADSIELLYRTRKKFKELHSIVQAPDTL